jgi:hypothetical protein
LSHLPLRLPALDEKDIWKYHGEGGVVDDVVAMERLFHFWKKKS